jgi:hypothetical protein
MMEKSIFNLEVDGKPALGFDTGLNAQAFAQAKMAAFLIQKGSVVYPDGRVETWQAGGVTEREGGGGASSMFIWGPCFPGERLTDITADRERSGEALDALRHWLRASSFVGGAGSPAGTLIVTGKTGGAAFPQGTIFFPPERLLKRCLEAEGVNSAGERLHPDLSGNEGTAYSAGIMLYEIFCLSLPFDREDPLLLRQDIREGVFMPPELACPGLDKDLAKLISGALAPVKQKAPAPRPEPRVIGQFLGPPGSRSPDSWLRTPGEEELAKIRLEQEQFKKRKALTVKTRRFLIRNTAIISVCFIAALVLLLGIRDFVKIQKEKPNTIGMSPREVVEAYYGAFERLDHEVMSGCVINKAGKQDIDMVINLFVISRVRGAYETTVDNVVSARDWKESGSPETDKTVFGVTDLKINNPGGGPGGGEMELEASYVLWIPASFTGDRDQESIDLASPPVKTVRGISYTDRLRLILHKNAWRIAGIERKGF